MSAQDGRMTKPALILDDDPYHGTEIARVVRGVGYDTQYLRSIEAFYRAHGLPRYNIPPEDLATVMSRYSVMTWDNNFATASDEDPGDGYLRGSDVLLTNVGPALDLLPPQERPLLVCFATSSESDLRQNEGALWNRHGISSFHKIYDRPTIALGLTIATEYGGQLNRQQLTEGVLGLHIDQQADQATYRELLFTVEYDFMGDFFLSEDSQQVVGAGIPDTRQALLDLFAQKRGVDPEGFRRRIETVIRDSAPTTPEGGRRGGKERS